MRWRQDPPPGSPWPRSPADRGSAAPDQLTSRSRPNAMAANVTPARAQVPRPASILPTSWSRAAATTSRHPRPVLVGRWSPAQPRCAGPRRRRGDDRSRHPLPQGRSPGKRCSWAQCSSASVGPTGTRARRSGRPDGAWNRTHETKPWGLGAYPATARVPGGGRGGRRPHRFRLVITPPPGDTVCGHRGPPPPTGRSFFLRSSETVMPKPLVIVESPAKAKTISSLPRLGLPRRVVDRAHPGPASQRRRRAGRLQGRALGPPWRRRRQRLQAPLRGVPGEA